MSCDYFETTNCEDWTLDAAFRSYMTVFQSSRICLNKMSEKLRSFAKSPNCSTKARKKAKALERNFNVSL
ncbi:uncharacterized protein B0P05DRAFT_538777, partial [Gilbertella persicaria]|uniref:uncharacterized protein n=1 Tax=Gilbertella persicaria TaxID=101096 RepID=UPI00221FA89F